MGTRNHLHSVEELTGKVDEDVPDKAIGKVNHSHSGTSMKKSHYHVWVKVNGYLNQTIVANEKEANAAKASIRKQLGN